MAEVIWINPEVKGSCSTDACGAVCCKFRIYTDSVNYTLDWCQYFNQETLRCNIYETRPEGCRKYPLPNNLFGDLKYPGCSYYLEESTDQSS